MTSERPLLILTILRPVSDSPKKVINKSRLRAQTILEDGAQGMHPRLGKTGKMQTEEPHGWTHAS